MEPQHNFNDEHINEEHICSICWSLLVKPIRFDCEHNFCYHCIYFWIEKEEEGIKCPKCRKFYPITTELKEDKALIKKLQTLYKKKYTEREEAVAKLIKEEERTGKIKFLYGNYLHKSEANKIKTQEWRFFLKPADPKIEIKKFIEKIEVNLDPAYGAKPIPLTNVPFEIRINSTTELDITFKIIWEKWLNRDPMSFIYYVTFNGGLEKFVNLSLKLFMEINHKIQQINRVISQTEKKLSSFFQFECASPIAKSRKTTEILTSNKKGPPKKTNKNKKNTIKNEKHVHVRVSTCERNKKKIEPKENNYEKTIKKLEKKKIAVLNELDHLENKGKTNTQTHTQNKKLKYEISVLRAELLHQKENNRKLFSELEKFKNRYKLNNFKGENFKSFPL